MSSIVSIEFWSGHTAKIIFSLTENLVGEIPITCYADTFEISHVLILDERTEKKIVVLFEPNPDFLLKYETNPLEFNSGDKHIITPPTQNFIKYISSTGKKDPLDLIVLTEDPNFLYVSNNNSSSGSNEKSLNKFKNTNMETKIIKFNNNKKNPNIKIPLSSFCDICTQINKNKKHHRSVVITGYKEGLIVASDTPSFEISRKWGDTTGKPIGKYSLTTDKNKFISNINGLVDRGVMLFFFEERKMRMLFPVSYYGIFSIIFDNGIEEEEDVEKEIPVMNDSELIEDSFGM